MGKEIGISFVFQKLYEQVSLQWTPFGELFFKIISNCQLNITKNNPKKSRFQHIPYKNWSKMHKFEISAKKAKKKAKNFEL